MSNIRNLFCLLVPVLAASLSLWLGATAVAQQQELRKF
jgi:hypothetical protein